MQEVAALLVTAIATRDDRAAKLLNRILTSATHRFRALVDELRLEEQGGRPTILMVGHASSVSVSSSSKE